MTYNFVPMDAEYNRSSEAKMNVVCLVAGELKVWTNRFKAVDRLHSITRLVGSLPQNTVFLSFAAEAEASALISLGIDPLKFKWIDLQLECKMLYNHNISVMRGKHLDKGREITIYPKSGEYGGTYIEKPPVNLASCLYHFLNIKIDTDEKNKMRDLIISEDNEEIERNKQRILDYCYSDTKYLRPLFDKIMSLYKIYIPKKHQGNLLEEMLKRGESSVRTALMVRHGYPVDVKRAKNLADNTPTIIFECAKDINSQFPELMPFKFNKKTTSFTMDTKVLREWIDSQKFKDWDLTDTGKYSLALESWEKYFPFRHEFPRNNLGAQILRYLKIQQSLRSFNFKSGTQSKTFFDYIGSDGMCRPFLNSFGAQSSRFQPASTGYLFLKPAFLRSLCYPPKDYLMGSIDYSSQEFLLAALLSGDEKMLEAYRQGDVYLYFAKESKMVPPHATKESHKKERDLAKATVLGISYSMTKVGLSRKLTSDTGRFVSEDEAQKYIDNFNKVFSKFYRWKQKQLDGYKVSGYMRLPDGWFMFSGNSNDRSVTNMPIQGFGGSVLRKAIELAQEDSLNVVAPLHDAAYIMFHKDDVTAMDRLAKAMIEAFCFYFEGEVKEKAKSIRLEFEVWGKDADKNKKYSHTHPVTVEDIHIDPRGKKEYEKFKPFFDREIDEELL